MFIQHLSQPRFSLGMLAALQEAGQDPLMFIMRHRSGDWGDVCIEDARANDEAVAHEGDPDRKKWVLSAYVTGKRLWMITEADRSSTCLLLPSEY
jgi:hypothetical protein